jgi:hypothetical protein
MRRIQKKYYNKGSVALKPGDSDEHVDAVIGPFIQNLRPPPGMFRCLTYPHRDGR